MSDTADRSEADQGVELEGLTFGGMLHTLVLRGVLDQSTADAIQQAHAAELLRGELVEVEPNKLVRPSAIESIVVESDRAQLQMASGDVVWVWVPYEFGDGPPKLLKDGAARAVARKCRLMVLGVGQ